MPNFLGDLTHSRYYIERPKVTKKIWNAIDRKNHILITSPRGAGKTSLLHDFCKNSKEDFKIAYVNAELINSKEEFFIRCIQAMLNCGIDRSELTLNFITDQLTPSLKTDSNLGLSIKIDKPPSNKQEIFFRALRGVNDQRKLAILMDELPQTINNMIREDGINCTIHFLQILREIRQSPDFTNIQFIFTGSTNLSEATDAFNATHLISDLIELRLPPLTEAEATHFIKQTLTDFDFSIADNQVEYLIHKIQPLFPSPINQFLRAIENIAIDEEVTQITNSEIDLAFARSINSILKPQAKIPFQKIKVTTLKIQNIKCFDDIQIDFDSSNAMELITGSNARGKTTILQLIALGLTGIKIMPFPYNWKQVIKSGAEQGQFELDILSDDKPVHLNFDIDSNDSITCTEGAEHLKSIQGKFLLLAYGANRYIKLEDPRPHPE
ncbi:MAG: Cdc6-like AAA superfamily ATPase, partial [Phenylobacterium sp.]